MSDRETELISEATEAGLHRKSLQNHTIRRNRREQVPLEISPFRRISSQARDGNFNLLINCDQLEFQIFGQIYRQTLDGNFNLLARYSSDFFEGGAAGWFFISQYQS